jgi:RNA polymerase sigma-70 factor (ECF subfamily)
VTQTVDNAAFVRLWTTGSRRVYAYILTLVTNRSDAEDLLQDVGVTAWEKFGEFDSTRDFVAWACGIAHYKVLGYLRSSRRYASLTDALVDEMHHEMIALSDVLDRQHLALQDCLSALSTADRLLIGLKYHPGMTIAQIAAQTGRSVAAIYKALQRIHDRLFECASRKLATEVRS